MTIHRTPDGVMWFGTGLGGISRYDEQTFTTLTTDDGLLSNYVQDSLCEPDGTLWLGTGGGVSRYDGKECVNFTTKDGLVHNIIKTIHSEPDEVIWFGTFDGLCRYNGKEFVYFTTEDGLANNYVAAIHKDLNGVLWLGTKGGISCYDGKKIVNFTQKNGLVGKWVRTIHQDQDGILWFGTPGSGVYGYDGIAWTSLDTKSGLAHNKVFSIDPDPDGTLWFSSSGGLVHYRRSKNPPGIQLVSVKIVDKDYTELQSIPPITAGTRVTIEYNAIDFKTLPERRQYRCRIKEVDDNWRKPTKSVTFDHTFKKPGDYTFEVQAIDRALNYSQPANLTLKVVPPFYMRAGFLASTVGGGTLLLATVIILATALTRRRHQVRAYERAAVRELQDANRVQMSLMPETAPPIEGLEIAGKCIPANTVSGDFFDYLEGKTNAVALVVADVCGKAMKGAMNAVMTDGILRIAAIEQGEFTPASLMMTLNHALKGRLERYMNVTMVIGMIDAESQTLTLSNAAHHAHPLLLRNEEIQILKMGGMPLGMMTDIQYTEEQFPLQSGDVIIFMTDGIIEAQDSEENYYSDSGRLEETIRIFTLDLPAEVMVDAIINDAIAFGGEKAQRDAKSNARLRLSDDMTVVVAKVL